MFKRAMLFDTETTGLIKNGAQRIDKQPHIIELFGLTLNESLEETATWQSLFSHHKPLDDIIVKITGITDEMIKDAPKFYTKAEELKAFIESCDAVVGHNLTYDMDMVNTEMERSNLKVNWPANRICTVEQTEWIKGYRLSLGALHEYLFGTGFKDAHRAESDVRAMARCYIELVKRGML